MENFTKIRNNLAAQVASFLAKPCYKRAENKGAILFTEDGWIVDFVTMHMCDCNVHREIELLGELRKIIGEAPNLTVIFPTDLRCDADRAPEPPTTIQFPQGLNFQMELRKKQVPWGD